MEEEEEEGKRSVVLSVLVTAREKSEIQHEPAWEVGWGGGRWGGEGGGGRVALLTE